MQDIVTQRFIKCHDEVLRLGLVRSSRQFALSVEYLPQSLSEILKGRRKVTLALARKCIEKYNVCPSYLFKGVGEPLVSNDSDTPAQSDVLVVVADKNNEERIVHVPLPAQAGYGGQLTDPEYIGDLPTFTLPDPFFQSGTFRSFDVSGDSMEPTIYSGERVVCAFCEKDTWRYNLKDNHVYVIITRDDIVVKRIENRINNEGSLILVSDNEYYPPRTVHIDEVMEIWSIKLKISPFRSSPNNVRNGLHSEIDQMRDVLKSQNHMIKELNCTIEKMLRQNRSR